MSTIPPLPGARFVPAELTSAFDRKTDDTPIIITGVGEGALPFVAPLLPRLLEKPILLVVPTRAIAESLIHDARFYTLALGTGEGATVAVRRPPIILPALEPEPYLGLSPHLQVVVERTTAIAHGNAGTASVVVLPAEALLLRVPEASCFTELARTVAVGDDLDRDDLIRDLARAGYRRQDMVGSVGEIAVRGGIIDVFSPARPSPFRIELFGDSVDSIRAFDPVSQRSEESLETASLLPLTPFPLDDDAETRLRNWGGRLLDSQLDDLRAKRHELRDKGTLPGIEYLAPILAPPLTDLTTSFPNFALVVVEPEASLAELEKARAALEQVHGEVVDRGVAAPTPDELALDSAEMRAILGRADVELHALNLESAANHASLRCQPGRQYEGRIKELVTDLGKDRSEGIDAIVVVPSAAEAERVEAMLSEYDLPYLEGERAAAVWNHAAPPPVESAARIAVVIGRLSQGFRSPALRLNVHASPEVFGGGLPPSRRRRRRSSSPFSSDFRDLKVGDNVVHVDHGVATFVGLKSVGVGDLEQEFMVLAYAGEDKLYVPLDRLDLIQKYSGFAGLKARVDTLGGSAWAKVKRKVKSELRSMTSELLKLYAARSVMQGHSFAPDGLFMKEFEDAFPYTTTADQQTAIDDVKHAMESVRCMDRLLCGDVGYGKTEVAMRSAFKAVADGKQVAVLAPTTVLTLQHFRTFSQRFKPFPVNIDMVSRFRSKKEIDAALEKVKTGAVDILIGTHRLLSRDVSFRDLGLLVIDEEQRFGVAHKEKLKQLRKGVDVLTMTATPIPRTLQMSLVGLRDMSVIETPPKDRLAIETTVLRFDHEVIKEAIKTEMERGGQVFFVHNRVESIDAMADAVRQIAPFARISIGHGQMREGELEKVMVDFMEKKSDVLVATTIIENGIDLPNVNTIIINRSQRLGLAQLYQLRGRVGRSERPAYAYLLVPPKAEISPVARRRLHAIQEFSDLGAGFRIAALDLEIRGAGNILGAEQSGHIASVGFDLYMELLEQTIRELKGDEVETVATQIQLRIDVSVPVDYIGDSNQRLMVYKKIAAAHAVGELDDIEREVADRFGPPPPPVTNLVEAARLKLEAQVCRIQAVERDGVTGRLRLGDEARVDSQGLVEFVSAGKGRKLHPDGRLEFPVTPGPEAIEEIRIVIQEIA